MFYRKKQRRIHSINHMVNTNNKNLLDLAPVMDLDDFKADLEEIINDGNYHSDEISETDIELTLTEK